jgi:hypothetical protein
MELLVAALVVGPVRRWPGLAPTAQGTWLDVVWVLDDLIVFSVSLQAGRYRGPRTEEATATEALRRRIDRLNISPENGDQAGFAYREEGDHT